MSVRPLQVVYTGRRRAQEQLHEGFHQMMDGCGGMNPKGASAQHHTQPDPYRHRQLQFHQHCHSWLVVWQGILPAIIMALLWAPMHACMHACEALMSSSPCCPSPTPPPDPVPSSHKPLVRASALHYTPRRMQLARASALSTCCPRLWWARSHTPLLSQIFSPHPQTPQPARTHTAPNPPPVHSTQPQPHPNAYRRSRTPPPPTWQQQPSHATLPLTTTLLLPC